MSSRTDATNLDVDLGVRGESLTRFGVTSGVHARIVATVKDVLGERDAGLGPRPWQLLAARMQWIGESYGPPDIAAARVEHPGGDEVDLGGRALADVGS